MTYFSECVVYEVTDQNKKGYIATVYRFLSQNNLEFQHSLSGFGKLFDDWLKLRPYFAMLFGNFNARSTSPRTYDTIT